MIERLWSGESGWWRLLLPLAWLYGAVSQLIAMCYRLGLKKSWRAPVPVVVVGNLTAGGNGKTPVVIWLVQALRRHGLNPAVVSRGYGGHAQHYPLIVESSVSTEQAGDEPVLIAQRTGVPVAVAPKRADAVRLLLNRYPNIDLIITDDGLQHLALQRDIEIVVIDGVRRFGNGWWLPAGPMRELASRLRSVDAIITNGGQAEAGEIGMHLQPGDLVNLSTGETRALSALPDVVAIAGIGHPARFFNTLQQAGIQPVKKIAFADHQAYRREELQALTREGQLLIMTEKDAVKCRAFAQDNWWYLPVSACLSAESGQLVDSIVMRARPDNDICCGNRRVTDNAALFLGSEYS